MKKLGVILSFVLIILLILNFASFASATLIEASHYYNSYSEAYDSNNWNTVDLTDNLVFNKNTQSYAGELKTVNYQESPDNFGEFPKLQTTDTLTFDYFSDGTVKNCHSITTTRSRYNSNYCNTYNGQPNLQPWISSLNNFKTCFENPSCNLFSYTQTSETTFTYNATCYSDKLVVEGSMNTPKFHRQNSQANYESYSEYVKLVSTRDFTLSDPKIYLDPEYISRTEQTRKFTPTQITPFDDIICEVKVQDACGVNSNSPVNLKAQLLTRDSSGNWNVVLEESQSSEWTGMSPLDSQGNSLDYQIYQWKIKGWSEPSPVGWTSDNDKMEELISAGKVKCVVSDASNPANTVSTMPVITSNCVHVWGKEDAVKVGFLRGETSSYSRGNSNVNTNTLQLSTHTTVYAYLDDVKNKYIRDGFNGVSPFKENSDKFSYFLDLKKFPDSSIITIRLGKNRFVLGNVEKKIDQLRSCKTDYNILFSSKVGVATGYGEHSILFNNEVIEEYFIRGQLVAPEFAIIHEFGHKYCGLNDEYDKREMSGGTRVILISNFLFSMGAQYTERNCKGPLWFPGAWQSYDINTGKDVYFANPTKGCDFFPENFRPSNKSLMNNFGFKDNRFNVVSCGYCLKKINGGILDTAWKQCMTMDTVKPNEQ